GWDQYTGYGRPDGRTLLAMVTPTTIPPEVDLIGPAWFDVIDPVKTPNVAVVGSARAVRADDSFAWVLEVGCGVQPLEYERIANGISNGQAIEDQVLAAWRPSETARDCDFDPAEPIEDPDAHTVTLRLFVVDKYGNTG